MISATEQVTQFLGCFHLKCFVGRSEHIPHWDIVDLFVVLDHVLDDIAQFGERRDTGNSAIPEASKPAISLVTGMPGLIFRLESLPVPVGGVS